MLQLIVAPPRSGKSYFAVNYLVGFTTYDPVYHEYVLNPNVLIISNIEGLKVKHWLLQDCLKKMSKEEFFSIANFEEIQKRTGKSHIILCIDEAHDIFPKGFSNTKVYSFFAYHGHIGLDCIFMTQGLEEFTRSFNPLFEYVVHVTQRSKAVAGAFSYTYRTVGGSYLYVKVLRKKQVVFDAYKSFRKDEHNKPKNALLMWAVLTLGIIACAVGLFKVAFGIVDGKSKQAAAKQVQTVKPLDSSKTNNPTKVPASSPAPAAAAAAPVAPAPDPRIVHAWRVYSVQGYLDNGSTRGYLINGRVVLAGVCRNYDKMTGAIECYGGQIPEQRGGASASPPAAPVVSGLPAKLPGEGGALAQPVPAADASMVIPIQSDPLKKYPYPDSDLDKFIASSVQ